MIRKYFVVFLLFSGSALASPTVINGKVFLHDTPRGKPAYLFKKTIDENNGEKDVHVQFLSLKGEVLVDETCHYAGDKLLRYTYDQKQMKEGGEISIHDGKVFYEFIKGGEIQRDDEKQPEDMMLADLMQPFIQNHWHELVDEEDTLHTHYLVLEKQDSYGFKFFTDGEAKCGSDDCMRIIMKPSSFLIAAFVNPIKILVEKKDPHRIREIDGRLPIRAPEVPNPKKRTDYAAIEAVLVLSY